ncbi:MAG TPA: hypothetical protein VFO67_08885 [Gemmatimonadales bacterium]|nr:hypothetical protein [Gemmatimonadales bacterium]
MNRWPPPSRVLLVLMLLVLVASTAEAQRRSRRRGGSAVNSGPTYGAHLGYNFDIDDMLLGAQLSWPITPDLAFYPQFDYYFVSDGSLWSLNFDLKWRPPTRRRVWYVAGGLNWAHASSGGTSGSDTNLGLATGLEGSRGKTRPYVEGRFILGNETSFQLVGGISWR